MRKVRRRDAGDAGDSGDSGDSGLKDILEAIGVSAVGVVLLYSVSLCHVRARGLRPPCVAKINPRC